MELTDDDMFIVYSILKEKNNSLRSNWFCNHYERKHYAKGVCSSCYHNPSQKVNNWLSFNGCRRAIRSVICGHIDRIHRARGLCSVCYTSFKRKRRLERFNA